MFRACKLQAVVSGMMQPLTNGRLLFCRICDFVSIYSVTPAHSQRTRLVCLLTENITAMAGRNPNTAIWTFGTLSYKDLLYEGPPLFRNR